MQEIHIHTRLNAIIFEIPELQPFLNESVEIIVRIRPTATRGHSGWVSPLAGSVLRDDDPFGAAVSAEDWEANQ